MKVNNQIPSQTKSPFKSSSVKGNNGPFKEVISVCDHEILGYKFSQCILKQNVSKIIQFVFIV